MRFFNVQLARDEFHKRIGGGFPAGSLVLIEGDHGSGKSVVCQRLLYGFLQNNLRATYISTQMTTIDFINQMTSMDYRINRELISGNLLYIPVYPLISKNIRRDNFIEKLIHAKSFYEKDAIFIDSLSTIIVNDASRENAEDLMAFFKRVAGTEKVIVYTVNPGELPEDVLEEIKLASTAILKLEIKPFGGDVKNVINIVKYNFAQSNFQKVTVFRVEPKVGMVVEITSIA